MDPLYIKDVETYCLQLQAHGKMSNKHFLYWIKEQRLTKGKMS